MKNNSLLNKNIYLFCAHGQQFTWYCHIPEAACLWFISAMNKRNLSWDIKSCHENGINITSLVKDLLVIDERNKI